MTKKDFELIANTMKTATTFDNYKKDENIRIHHALTCNQFALNLAETNERFNRVKFLEACGLDNWMIENL